MLRPGGRLVAVTNGDEHVADLRRDAGGGPVPTFSSENGEPRCAHFDAVGRDDLRTRAVFPDPPPRWPTWSRLHEDVAWSLPETPGPREYPGHVTVFVAS